MRLGRVAVPPAPGMSPMETSGNRIRVSGAATTRPAVAAISMPAPTQAPWTWAVVRDATGATAAATLREMRTRWAFTGSGAVPNSSRSPPLQKLGPRPDKWTDSTVSSVAATASASHKASRRAAFERVVDVRSVEDDLERVIDPVEFEHPIFLRSHRGHRPAGQPPGVLGSPLERRVGQRLDDQSIAEGESGTGAQHLGEEDGGRRCRRHGGQQLGECALEVGHGHPWRSHARLGLHEDDVEAGEGPGTDIRPADPHGHEGRRPRWTRLGVSAGCIEVDDDDRGLALSTRGLGTAGQQVAIGREVDDTIDRHWRQA